MAQSTLPNKRNKQPTNKNEANIQYEGSKLDIEARDVNWTNCGPTTKAIEGVSGGKAIPHFAYGRGNGIGRINAIYVHPKVPNRVYATSITGGLFFSNNNGEEWTAAGTDELSPSGVGAFGMHYRRTNWWILSDGDHENQKVGSSQVMLTTDGGRSYQALANDETANGLPWFKSNNEGRDFVINKILWDPIRKNKIWLVTNQGIWLSDALQISRKGRLLVAPEWTLIAPGNFFDLIFHKKGKKVQCVASSDKLWSSSDGGKKWNEVGQSGKQLENLDFDRRMTLQMHNNLPNFVFVSVTSRAKRDGVGTGKSALYLVDVRNGSWQLIQMNDQSTMGPSNLRPRAWSVNPINHNHLVLADVQPVYFSTDGGKSFKKSVANLMHDDTHQLLFSADGHSLYAAHDGGVSLSVDGGLHWVDRSNGLACANVFSVACSPIENETIVYGAYDTGINSLQPNKHQHLIWGDGFDCDFLSESNRAVATIQDGAFLRADSNLIFEMGRHPNTKSEWRTQMSVHPLQPECVFVAGKKLVRSIDGGETWQTILDVQSDTSLIAVYDVFISEFDKNSSIAYAFTKSEARLPRLLISHNTLQAKGNEVTWKLLPNLPVNEEVVAIVFHPIQKEQFWLLTSNIGPDGKLWFFNGKQFEDVSANLGSAKCESMIVNREKFALLIGSDRGVFCKDLYEPNFRRFTGYPHCAVKTMDIDYKSQQLYIGTFGRGIWRCSLSDL